MTIAVQPAAAPNLAAADDDHERIVIRQDAATGLRFIVAVHSTVLGPALGGMRLKRYAGGLREALDDVMGLARTMTLKASGRRPAPGWRQGSDDRRRPHRDASGASRGCGAGDRRARRRLHHGGGHRHHLRRHGSHAPVHPLRDRPFGSPRRWRRPLARHRRERLPGHRPRTGRGHRIGRAVGAARRRDRSRKGRRRARRAARRLGRLAHGLRHRPRALRVFRG